MAGWHWRNTMRPARFFALDARAALPFTVMFLHARLWTLVLAICFTAFFYWVERKGMTYEAGLRLIRSWIVGPYRSASAVHMRRRMLDKHF